MVSSLAYNMSTKLVSDYNAEEKNIYSALKQFSKDLDSDLKLLGNFDEIKTLFDEVVEEKEQILEKKAKGFIPTAKEELKTMLLAYKEKTNKRIKILESNDREYLLEQKKSIEGQIGKIKADITAVFGELNAKLESEKSDAVRELREAGKDYLNVKERTGSKTIRTSHRVSDAKWWNPLSWFSSHTEYSSHTEHYSYCIAADAIENLRKYALEASNQVEKVFTEALQIKEVKRKLLNVVISNFDMGSEKYDSSLFRIMVEESVSAIEFPILNLDISATVNKIAGKFNGELTSASEKTALSTALSNAIMEIYDELCNKLVSSVKKFKEELGLIGHKVQDNLLTDISEEFETLLSQFENKEKEIANFKAYAEILDKKIASIR
jgi:hypothetical protein